MRSSGGEKKVCFLANWAVQGGRGRAGTCALDYLTSFLTGRHASTQMDFTTEVPPLVLKEMVMMGGFTTNSSWHQMTDFCLAEISKQLFSEDESVCLSEGSWGYTWPLGSAVCDCNRCAIWVLQPPWWRSTQILHFCLVLFREIMSYLVHHSVIRQQMNQWI